MTKKNYSNVNLACSFQQVEELSENQCLNGVFSKTTEGFRFEEAAKGHRDKRNPKLFDGNYISMVKMQNGRYHFHLKTFDISIIDRPKVAMGICDEIVTALQIAD